MGRLPDWHLFSGPVPPHPPKDMVHLQAPLVWVDHLTEDPPRFLPQLQPAQYRLDSHQEEACMEIFPRLEQLQMGFLVRQCRHRTLVFSLARPRVMLRQCLRILVCSDSPSKRIALSPRPRPLRHTRICLLLDPPPSSDVGLNITITLPARYQPRLSIRQQPVIPAGEARLPTWDGQEHRPKMAIPWRSNRPFPRAIQAGCIVLRLRLEEEDPLHPHPLSGEVVAWEDLGSGLMPVM